MARPVVGGASIELYCHPVLLYPSAPGVRGEKLRPGGDKLQMKEVTGKKSQGYTGT